MRRPPLLTAAAVLLVASGCSGGSGGDAAASCTGPDVTVTPAQARAGEPVAVAVEWLREGCDDYSGADEERALTGVPVTLVQGAAWSPLGTVDGSGPRYGGEVTVVVPADVVAGPASVVLGEQGRALASAPFTVLP